MFPQIVHSNESLWICVSKVLCILNMSCMQCFLVIKGYKYDCLLYCQPYRGTRKRKAWWRHYLHILLRTACVLFYHFPFLIKMKDELNFFFFILLSLSIYEDSIRVANVHEVQFWTWSSKKKLPELESWTFTLYFSR